MRKRLGLVVAGLILVAVALLAWRFTAGRAPAYVSEAFGANPRAALQQELADPSSVWAKALRNPADLARFKDAPAYRIELDYEASARLLKGEESILYTNTTGQVLPTLYLTTRARAWGYPPGEKAFTLRDLLINGQTVAYSQKELYGEIQLERPLKPGETAVVTLSFEARIPGVTVPRGQWTFDPTIVPPTYGGNTMLADGLTEAIPVLTTNVDGLTDLAVALLAKPTYSLIDLQITLPEKWRVISGGTTVERVSLPEGGTRTRLVGAAYSFTLFATSQLVEVRGEKNGVAIAVNYPVLNEAAGKAMLEDAARFVEIYEQAMGPYPFPELEIMPILAGTAFSGMNRSGLVFLDAGYYANSGYQPAKAVTDPYLRTHLTFDPVATRVPLLSHEIAHSWWGDLVWPDHEQGPWWLETITEATAIAGLERAFGAEVGNQRRDQDTFSYRVARAQGLPDHAYGRPPTAEERSVEYLSMTYLRPALFYDKVRRQVGDEAFFAAMRRYLEKGRFTVRSDRGPVEELLALPGVEPLFQRWMLETHGDEDLGRLTDEQARQLGITK